MNRSESYGIGTNFKFKQISSLAITSKFLFDFFRAVPQFLCEKYAEITEQAYFVAGKHQMIMEKLGLNTPVQPQE